MEQKQTAAECLRREAVLAENHALEEAKIADALDAELARRREAASDWRFHAAELRAAAERLEAPISVQSWSS